MLTRRKQCTIIGRIVTCHPTEGDKYYLRLLLMNVRAPKSYEDLLDYMIEAISFQLPYSLRRVFTTLLVYCNPTNPKELWEQFEESMSEDFKISKSIELRDVQHRVLNHINDELHSMGHDRNEYKPVLENIQPFTIEKEAKDNISNKAGAFFIDGPGGTGKGFFYRSLLATIRSKGFVALATASSGVATSILPGGRTTHSRFKIPINVDENIGCNVSKQSSLACLIRDAKLIVEDEASMAKAKTIEAFGLLLKDLMDTRMLFGGKVVVLGGDFRQTLPVVRNGKKEDFISQSLLYLEIWNQLEKLHLLENMRARTYPAFSEYLMRIGDGNKKLNSQDKVEIPSSLHIPLTTEEQSLQELFNVTYPNIDSLFHDSSSLSSHVILTTKNDYVHEINDMLISKFPNTARSFIAIDEIVEPNDQSQFEDDLHSLNSTNFPPYRLTLK
ncbi:hypothetical protein H5410_041144 [Solanum commersonii]|uniref:ATP-dependent DNA helicase n=1 Tax=Solanum commersonii TaxID=4109 RepID=A0A9J5XUL8_SOLCO|nr:hypothetical protein H5410_041144 [Solanum commersonii]